MNDYKINGNLIFYAPHCLIFTLQQRAANVLAFRLKIQPLLWNIPFYLWVAVTCSRTLCCLDADGYTGTELYVKRSHVQPLSALLQKHFVVLFPSLHASAIKLVSSSVTTSLLSYIIAHLWKQINVASSQKSQVKLLLQ